MSKAADPWNGWMRDNTKAHKLDKLKARLTTDPTLLGRLIGQLKHYIDPDVGSYDAMMIDEEATLKAEPWNKQPDRLYRQAWALQRLCHAGATHSSWWQGHHPTGKPSVTYPGGQANYLYDCIWFLIADGVRLPRHLRAIFDGKRFPPPVTVTDPRCECSACKAPLKYTYNAPAWTRFKGQHGTRAQRRA